MLNTQLRGMSHVVYVSSPVEPKKETSTKIIKKCDPCPKSDCDGDTMRAYDCRLPSKTYLSFFIDFLNTFSFT